MIFSLGPGSGSCDPGHEKSVCLCPLMKLNPLQPGQMTLTLIRRVHSPFKKLAFCFWLLTSHFSLPRRNTFCWDASSFWRWDASEMYVNQFHSCSWVSRQNYSIYHSLGSRIVIRDFARARVNFGGKPLQKEQGTRWSTLPHLFLLQ